MVHVEGDQSRAQLARGSPGPAPTATDPKRPQPACTESVQRRTTHFRMQQEHESTNPGISHTVSAR